MNVYSIYEHLWRCHLWSVYCSNLLLNVNDAIYIEVRTKILLQMMALWFLIFFIDFGTFKIRFVWILHVQKLPYIIIFLLYFKWRKKAESSSCRSFDYCVMYSRSICMCCVSYWKENSARVMFCHMPLFMPTRERDK